MSIISPAIFEGAIFIPQMSQLAVEESVQICIDTHEPKGLRKLLGVKMYDDAVAASNLQPVPQPWAALFDGDNYAGDSKYFDGLKQLIAHYVYWFYMSENAAQSAQVGVVKPKSENATPASPVFKMVTAWNIFVDMTCQAHEYITEHGDDFPDYRPMRDSKCGCGRYNIHGCCGSRPLFSYKNSLGL